MRTAYDFSPLYRSMIGVDRVADLIETAMKSDGSSSYPPYDIEKAGDDAYCITIAAAGFSSGQLCVTAQPNLLVVSGRKDDAEGSRTFLHRGIAHRDFERRFELADYVVVKSAGYIDGLLVISLAREVPDSMKPRTVPIRQGADEPVQTVQARPPQSRAA